MSIRYIKENINKFDHDNLISFLFDIVIRGGLDDIEDFDDKKQYFENAKVYVKDEQGIHHIYKCIVKRANVGKIYHDEWLDLLQSFRKPIVTDSTLVTQLDIKELVLISDIVNQTEFYVDVDGVAEGDYTAVVYHPELGRLSRDDFSFAHKTITLKNEYKVVDIGSKLIVDLYRNL